jgi:hypothetical protein
VPEGAIIFEHACKLGGCEGIVSKRLGSLYRSGRSRQWLKVKYPAAPAVRREAEEDCGRQRPAGVTRSLMFRYAPDSAAKTNIAWLARWAKSGMGLALVAQHVVLDN